jgi:hypothetical protein
MFLDRAFGRQYATQSMPPVLKIASPCPASWDRMQGDDKARHCSECNLNVYNFAAMTSAEIEELTASHTGRLCGRLYRRTDGTVLTKDCPVGARIVVKRRSYLAGAALSVALSLGSAVAAQVSKSDPSAPQRQQRQGQAEVLVLVEDPTGAVMPNASVALVNQANQAKVEGVTDSLGKLQFPNLHSGVYQLTVQVAGLSTQSSSLHLGKHQQLKANVEMYLPVMGEVVAVPVHRNPVKKLLSKLKP